MRKKVAREGAVDAVAWEAVDARDGRSRQALEQEVPTVAAISQGFSLRQPPPPARLSRARPSRDPCR